MLQDMLPRHLVTLFLIILLSILLRSQKSFRDSELRYFWLTVLSCLLLMFEDALEIIASENPSLRFWRILLSVLGYTFRSTAALGLLLVVVPREKRTFRLWVPALITLAVSATAFFSDIAFSFDEDYDFCRGPLGYVAFVVGSKGTGEVHVTACQLVGPLLGIHILKLHQGHRVGTETILLDKERHQYAVKLQDEVVGIHAVENVIVELQRHLTPHAVGLAQTAYTVDFFLLNHVVLF